MGGLKFGIHPLFYLFGVYYALTGRIFVFVIYTLTAVIHELGHSFAATSAGYKLNKITLMPFGAVAYGEIDGVKCAEELKIAFAGPFVNISVGLLFVALWWIFPELYAYTDLAAEANFSMALINFLPVYPLDGGRIFSSILALKLKRKTAETICRITGFVTSGILLALFALSLFHTVNLSLLFFSLFVLFGLVGKSRENRYVRLFSGLSAEKLKHGMPYKKQAVDMSVTVKKLMTLLDVEAVNEIVVYENGKPAVLLSQEKISEILKKGELYSPISKYLA